MKAVRFHQYGGPEVLRLEDVADPTPGPGQVVVRVAGSAFNPADDGIRGGWLQEAFPLALPHTPGYDVSGTVVAIGAGVGGISVGDEVVGFLPMDAPGSAAEQVLAPADALVPAPTSVALADAAALPSVALTAWQALVDDAGVRPGQRVLVNGAGGAVGGYAVQLGRHLGLSVVAVASPRSADRVRAQGADRVVDPADADLAAAVGGQVDVLLNLAGVDAERLDALTALVRDGGVVVTTVPAVPARGDEARGVRAAGVFVRSDPGRLRELVAMVDGGQLVVDVAERRPLADLPSVHARAEAGQLSGKVVVRP